MNIITIIGSGMLGINQITTEGFSVIQRISWVFWNRDISGPHEYLSHYKIHHSDVITECKHVTFVIPGYLKLGIVIVKYCRKLFQDGIAILGSLISTR